LGAWEFFWQAIMLTPVILQSEKVRVDRDISFD
jgi:hypothetical protein